jgi:hypothetical protein
MFVDAAVWLGLVRVLRFLKLGSGAGDEVDASSCGGAVVTALAGSRLPGLRASSLVALEASLPCTMSMQLRVRVIVAAFDWGAGGLAGAEDTAALGACVLARRRRPANGSRAASPALAHPLSAEAVS